MFARILALTLAFAATPAALAQDPAPTAETAKPTYDRGFAFRPTFLLQEGSITAGVAFAVEHGGKPVGISAYHLFGPAGGHSATIAGADLPTAVREVILRDVFTGEIMGRGEAPRALADATTMNEDIGRDMVFFAIKPADPTDVNAKMEGRLVHPKPLATGNPKVGDTITLIARLDSGTEQELAEHKAKVVFLEGPQMYYEFVAKDLNLTATNGGPLLNDKGQVVGMHLGGGPMDGQLIGAGVPVATIQGRMDKAGL